MASKLLPTRRASASTGSVNSASTSRVGHRTNDSHHGLVGQPSGLSQSISAAYSSAAGSTTPQQKVVQTLVTRIKNKLPCHSGLNLTAIESDHALQQTVEALVDLSRHSLDIIAYALSELLEKLSKLDHSGHRTIEVLQSQLFILKVLSVAMAHRWPSVARIRDEQRPSSRLGKSSTGSTDIHSSSPASIALRNTAGHKSSFDQLSGHASSIDTPNILTDPLPLDDAGAKYILSVMLIFVRQSSPEAIIKDAENLTLGASLHDFESIELEPGASSPFEPLVLLSQGGSVPGGSNQNGSTTSVNSSGGASIPLPRSSFVFKSTPSTLASSPMSLGMLITKFAGHIIYHLSISNWKIVLARIRSRIHTLAGTQEEAPDTLDLRILTYCALDRGRLTLVLQELSSLLVNMKRESQHAVSAVVRTAVWNWIENFTHEYNETINSQRRLDGAPERVFDLLFQISDPTSNRVIWPTLIVLMCISPERMKHAAAVMNPAIPSRIAKKEANLLDQLHKHAGSNSKLADVAITCQLDICRAAIRIRPDIDILQKSYASDISDEIKTRLLKSGGHRPFWDLADEIDVALHAEAIVAVYRFLPEEESLPLLRACLEPERSDAVKICAVRACLTLALKAHQLPSQPSLVPLHFALASRIRQIFSYATLRLSESDANGNVKRASPRPSAKRYTNETISDRELLLLAIMSLFRADVSFFFTNFDEEENIYRWIHNTAQIFQRPNDSAVRLSASRTFANHAKFVLTMRPDDAFFSFGVTWIRHATPMALVNLCNQLFDARENFDEQRACVITIASVLLSWTFISPIPEHREWQMSEERIHPLALGEIVLLISLTSADTEVAQKAAMGLRTLALLERQPDAPQNPGMQEDERKKRYPVYERLAERKGNVIGRVVQQKNIRWHLRNIASPSPFFVGVWEEVYHRWSGYSNTNPSSINAEFTDAERPVGDTSTQDEFKRQQWQNHTLFLASFGSCCLGVAEAQLSLDGMIDPQILPDRLRVLHPPEPWVNHFVSEMVEMLVSEDIFMRETAKEALGSELSPKLYGKLFVHIHGLILQVFNNEELAWRDELGTLIDQLMSILKLMLDRVDPYSSEILLASDLTTILLGMARIMTRFKEEMTLRPRMKLCLLCDTMLIRLDSLALRKEDDKRAALLDVVLGWMEHPNVHPDPASCEFQQELNLVVLGTVAKLLDRLRLKPLVDAGAEDAAHAVNRLFNRYSGMIFKALSFHHVEPSSSDQASIDSAAQTSSRPSELRSIVIDALSNLHLANLESGFKQFSSHMSEHFSDVRRRSVFLSLSARILSRGASLESGEEPVSVVKRSRLCELVKSPDNILALAICETCPGPEVDMIIPVLLDIFDTRVSLGPILQTLIDKEIAQTESPAQILRGNTICSRMLSAVAKIHGYTYLRSLILPLIKTMTSMPEGGGTFDLDPAKALGQDVKQNRRNVELVANAFIEVICNSVGGIPPMFYEICSYIAKAVHRFWPESKYAGMGAFMFLRFISPGIVSPELVDIDIPTDDGGIIRRGLMVIAKIVQNLANNIFFGKEQHMTIMNDFLQAKVVDVMRYLHEIEKSAAVALEQREEEPTDELVYMSVDETDAIVLQRFFERHTDKIGKELLSTTKPLGENDPAAIGGKRAWDALCAAMVDLGTPPEVLKSPTRESDDMPEYKEFMERFRGQDLKETVKVVFEIPSRENLLVMIVMHRIDVEISDVELLLYALFKILTSHKNRGRMFDLILDYTGIPAAAGIPMHWIRRCVDLYPKDVHVRLHTIHILNPNTVTQKNLRKLVGIAGDLCPYATRVHLSVQDLLTYLQDDNITDLAVLQSQPSAVLESEARELFEEVSFKFSQQPRIVVRLEVRETHIRITSTKAQYISPSLSLKSTEIIYYGDIGDVYNVSTGHEQHEFIVRLHRAGTILYFSSPERDQIVKSIRAAKSNMKVEHRFGAERFQRLQNIIATLLHFGLRDLTHDDSDVRVSAFDLLSAVCSYLGLVGFGKLPSRAAFIAGHPPIFINSVSEALASKAPRYTLEFLTEVVVSMDKAPADQRIKCLQYLSPWVKNLASFPVPSSSLYEHSGARLRECARALIQFTLRDAEVFPMTQKYIWTEIGRLDSAVVNIILDELIRTAIDCGPESRPFDLIAETTASMASINVRGRLLVKLRKILGKTSTKPTKTLPENAQWNELACLVRLVLVVGYHYKPWIHNQMFAPELMHSITMLAGTGQTAIRTSVYGIFMCFLQALINYANEGSTGTELRLVSETSSQSEILCLFGLKQSLSGNELVAFDPPSDAAAIDDTERLAAFLTTVLEKSAGSKGILNVWRARWMSLATSMAFQLSPPVQARSFIVMGVLASSDVDDDLFYQMLVAFRSALVPQDNGTRERETNTFLVVSMLRSFSHVVQRLQDQSRYLMQFFWLAVALLESSHVAFYAEATKLLRATMITLDARGAFKEFGVAATLLQGRQPLEPVLNQLDQLLGVSFETSFSFSLAAVIFKGVRHSAMRATTESALRELLQITSKDSPPPRVATGLAPAISPEALGYFAALIPYATTHEKHRELLKLAMVDPTLIPQERPVLSEDDTEPTPHIPFEILTPPESQTALLLTSFISVMISSSQGDDAETEILYNILSDAANYYPDAIVVIYEGLQDSIRHTFANSNNSAILKAVSDIFRVIIEDPARAVSPRGSASTLSTVEEGSTHGAGRNHMLALEELNMGGLAAPFQFLPHTSPPNEGAKRMIEFISELVTKIIE